MQGSAIELLGDDDDYDETREEDEMFSGEAMLSVKEVGGSWTDSVRVFIR